MSTWPNTHPHRRFTVLPTTRAGRWAVALAVAGVALVLAWSVLPMGALAGFVAGAAAGGAAIVAIRRGDRAVTVVLAILPLLWVVVFIVAELAFPHG